MFKVDKEKCVGCGACVNVCPAGAISIEDNKAEISDKCLDCGRCAQVCPVGAIYPGAQSGRDISFNQGQVFPGSGQGRGMGRGMGRGLGRGPRDGRGGGRGGGRE
jgi:Fe-S-cluster-containing hydrogenase component 2